MYKRRAQQSILALTRHRRLHTALPRLQEHERFDPTNVERASDEVDVCIVGAGPAGLSAAIRLKQLNEDLRVVVLEKGAEVGEPSLLSLFTVESH